MQSELLVYEKCLEHQNSQRGAGNLNQNIVHMAQSRNSNGSRLQNNQSNLDREVETTSIPIAVVIEGVAEDSVLEITDPHVSGMW